MINVTVVAKEILSSLWIRFFGMNGEFKALKEKTAIVYTGILPREVCETLSARIDRILEDDKSGRVWHDNCGSDSRILGFERDIVDIVECFDIDNKIKAIDDYLGFKTRSWCLMANRVLAKDGNLGSGGGLHRDSPFSHQVKCIWYLSDVTEDSGPFEYLPGSHLDLMKKRASYSLGQMRFDRVHEKMQEVHAPAGTLLVCDTKCIHRGKPIKKGVRYAVTLYTYPREDGVSELFRKSDINLATSKNEKIGR